MSTDNIGERDKYLEKQTKLTKELMNNIRQEARNRAIEQAKFI